MPDVLKKWANIYQWKTKVLQKCLQLVIKYHSEQNILNNLKLKCRFLPSPKTVLML